VILSESPIEGLALGPSECTTWQRILNRRGSANCMEAGASIKPIKVIWRSRRVIVVQKSPEPYGSSASVPPRPAFGFGGWRRGGGLGALLLVPQLRD
jgi:hypothetical protein